MLCEIAHFKTQIKNYFQHKTQGQTQSKSAQIRKNTQNYTSFKVFFKRFFGPRDSCDNHTWTLISRNNQNVEHPNSFQFENG